MASQENTQQHRPNGRPNQSPACKKQTQKVRKVPFPCFAPVSRFPIILSSGRKHTIKVMNQHRFLPARTHLLDGNDRELSRLSPLHQPFARGGQQRAESEVPAQHEGSQSGRHILGRLCWVRGIQARRVASRRVTSNLRRCQRPCQNTEYRLIWLNHMRERAARTRRRHGKSNITSSHIIDLIITELTRVRSQRSYVLRDLIELPAPCSRSRFIFLQNFHSQQKRLKTITHRHHRD